MGFFRKIRDKWNRDILDSLTELSNRIDRQSDALDSLNIVIERQNSVLDEMNNINKRLETIEQVVNRLVEKVDSGNLIVSNISGNVNAYLPFLRDNHDEILANVNSVYSFCLNEAVKRQTDLEKTDIYRYYQELHDLTRCKMVVDKDISKVRVGREHDGGYVMIFPFSSNKIAYSLGICDDVSWDKDMTGYGYQIYQYDHTIDSLPEENDAFHWKKIGLTGEEETDELKRLETLIAENGHNQVDGMVLKMDIEGYEWDLLMNCDANVLRKFDQITMEVHGLNDLNNSKKIIKAFKKLVLDFNVIHIHGNNYRYATFCNQYITPDVLEITLIRKGFFQIGEESAMLMEEIDQVNRSGAQDIWIGKW